MAEADWWRGAVIYQIYPRSFLDTNGDGIGDLRGVTERLGHVADLGVDTIWLCPFFVSPQRDFGYDVADHRAVDPIFGDMADFDALLARAHALGLKVLIDQVWSHTSDRHLWFLASRGSRTGAKSDWYVWADPAVDGTPPNNWLSVFGGAAWTWEPRRRHYYLHHFLSHQPALNLHNPAVVDAMLEIGRFWLDRGVDGFRLDAVDFLLHDPALRPNPAALPPKAIPAKLFAMQQHLHNMLQPEAAAIKSRIRGLLDHYPGTATLGEISSQPGAFERVTASTRGSQHLQMAYTLRPLRGGFDHAAISDLLNDPVATGTEGWTCWSFSNHDVERAVSRWNPPTRGGTSRPGLRPPADGPATFVARERLPLPGRGTRADRSVPAGGRSARPVRHRLLAGVSRLGREPGADAMGRGAPALRVYHRRQPMAADARGMLRGTLRPVAVPAPLIGFVREHHGARVLALFNLSDGRIAFDRTQFGRMEVMAGSGFADPGSHLPPFGAVFASIEPAAFVSALSFR